MIRPCLAASCWRSRPRQRQSSSPGPATAKSCSRSARANPKQKRRNKRQRRIGDQVAERRHGGLGGGPPDGAARGVAPEGTGAISVTPDQAQSCCGSVVCGATGCGSVVGGSVFCGSTGCFWGGCGSVCGADGGVGSVACGSVGCGSIGCVCGGSGEIVLGRVAELEASSIEFRTMFIPMKKQAAPEIATATASHRSGCRHLVNSGHSSLIVRLR